MAQKTLKRADTVILGVAVAKMKSEEKSLDAQIADFVYRSSHVWSMRFTERASECYDENVEVDETNSKTKFTGLKPFIAACFSVHDAFEDFQFEIHEINYTGDLSDGTITYRYTCHGKMKLAGKEMDIPGVNIYTVKNGKVKFVVVKSEADQEHTKAILKQADVDFIEK